MSLLSLVRSAAVAVPLLAVAACGVADAVTNAPAAGSGVLQDVAQQRARWAASGVRDYTYLLDVSCACSPEVVKQVRVVVRGGRTASVTYASDGSAARWTGFQGLDTVEELFATVERAARENADYLTVQYETARRLGYPVSVVIDPDRHAADDEMAFSVPSLTVDTP